jgi:hypothetical protein
LPQTSRRNLSPLAQESRMDKADRRKLRFPPDAGAIAWIDPTEGQRLETFSPRIPALIIDESRDGCGVAVLYHPQMMEGARMLVQIGELIPVPCEVRWIKDLDEDVLKVGLRYLE